MTTKEAATRARQLAAQGLSATAAAHQLGLTHRQMLTLAMAEGISFDGKRRASDWEKPDTSDPEALRQWYVGQKRNLTWAQGRRRGET